MTACFRCGSTLHKRDGRWVDYYGCTTCPDGVLHFPDIDYSQSNKAKDKAEEVVMSYPKRDKKQDFFDRFCNLMLLAEDTLTPMDFASFEHSVMEQVRNAITRRQRSHD